MEFQQLVRRRQSPEASMPAVRCASGRGDVAGGLGGEGQPAVEAGHALHVTGPLQLAHRLVPHLHGCRRLPQRLPRLPQPLQHHGQQLGPLAVPDQREGGPEVAGGLVVGGEAVGPVAGLHEDAQGPVGVDLAARPPVVVGEPVEVPGPNLLDGLGQPGVQSPAGDGGQLAGRDVMDERVGEAVDDVGPVVVLDHQSRFDQAPHHLQQLVRPQPAGPLEKVVGLALGPEGDQLDRRPFLRRQEIEPVDDEVLHAVRQRLWRDCRPAPSRRWSGRARRRRAVPG